MFEEAMRILASLVLLAGLCTTSPALAQTTNAPFGDVAHHVVWVDGGNFNYVTARSDEPVVCRAGKSNERSNCRANIAVGCDGPTAAI
jgi:hypothetical protein